MAWILSILDYIKLLTNDEGGLEFSGGLDAENESKTEEDVDVWNEAKTEGTNELKDDGRHQRHTTTKPESTHSSALGQVRRGQVRSDGRHQRHTTTRPKSSHSSELGQVRIGIGVQLSKYNDVKYVAHKTTVLTGYRRLMFCLRSSSWNSLPKEFISLSLSLCSEPLP